MLATGTDAAPEAAAAADGAAAAALEEASWDPTRILPSTLVDPDDGDPSIEAGSGPLLPLDRKVDLVMRCTKLGHETFPRLRRSVRSMLCSHAGMWRGNHRHPC